MIMKKWSLRRLLKNVQTRKQEIESSNLIVKEQRIHRFMSMLVNRKFTPNLIYDIGANHGHFTECAIHYFPHAEYFLFEPNPACQFEKLMNKGYKVNSIQKAVSNVNGKSDFVLTNRDDSCHLGKNRNTDQAEKVIEVETITLDTFIDQHNGLVPDIIKIDADGHDLKIVKSASLAIGKTGVVLIEADAFPGDWENSIDHVLEYFKLKGYKLADITDLNYSPKYGVLWLVELAFVKADRQEFVGVDTYE
jgi:FkbM family methyltransferase